MPQLVIELADVRILALGTITKPRSNFSINPNAHLFLNPPGIVGSGYRNTLSSFAFSPPSSLVDDHGVYPNASATIPPCCKHSLNIDIVSFMRQYSRIRKYFMNIAIPALHIQGWRVPSQR